MFILGRVVMEYHLYSRKTVEMFSLNHYILYLGNKSLKMGIFHDLKKSFINSIYKSEDEALFPNNHLGLKYSKPLSLKSFHY